MRLKKPNEVEETREQLKLDMKMELMNDLKKSIEESNETSDLIGHIKTLKTGIYETDR